MTDEELIGYCDLHCRTDRALFKGHHVNRMLELAGHPEGFVHSVSSEDWLSLHEPMATLVSLAKARRLELHCGGVVIDMQSARKKSLSKGPSL